ncbi:MAG: CoA transferase [Rhodospirillales bacterium]|nr:CoA transferase [Rhodospirillales bacterium]
MPGALDGLKVIDLSSHLSGPYCTMILGDLGADVIKIERPGSGDDARSMPPFLAGESAPFMLWNRNKRSVALDFKESSGREALLRLVETADILVENFRPGTLERQGLGYGVLGELNPRLIYCAISGFGRTGPLRDKGGFDLMTQAMSGLMAVCGPVDGPPHRLPIAISDIGAGMFATIGILAALEARRRTGRGQMVETSLLEAAMSFGVYEAANYFATGERPVRLGQAHRGNSPYQVMKTADGWLTIGGGSQALWEKICDVVGLPQLREDSRFRTNADRVANNDSLIRILEDRLATAPTAHWQEAFDAAGVPSAPVLHHGEMFAHPQVQAREMVVELEHPSAGRVRTLGCPIKLSRTPASLRRPAPRLGEHTGELFPARDDTGD